MDANRLQLAAALQARDNPQGGQMAQQGYAQRPGIPTRQGMPQQPMQGMPMPSQGMPPMQGMQQPQPQQAFPGQGPQNGYGPLNLPPQAAPQAAQAIAARPQFGMGAPGMMGQGNTPQVGMSPRPMMRPR